MKILKRVLIVITALVAIVLITALFVEKKYTLEREITINKPKDQVFTYIKYLKNQEQYNKWVMADPKMQRDYNGTDGNEGFVYTWKSDKAGAGEQEIKKIVDGERIDQEIRFKEPFSGLAKTSMTTTTTPESHTKVKWVFNSEMNYPMNAMMLFMDMNDVLGKDLDTSLHRLKNNLEQQQF